MVGYCPNGYRLWCPVEKKIIAGRDVKFDEGSVAKIQGNIAKFEFDDSDNRESIVSDVQKENVSELDCDVDNRGNNGGGVPELRRSERINHQNILRIMQPVLITLNLMLTIYQ
jgi:hypothetical protein